MAYLKYKNFHHSKFHRSKIQRFCCWAEFEENFHMYLIFHRLKFCQMCLRRKLEHNENFHIYSILERDWDVCLEPKLIDLSSHAALTKKRKISDRRAVIWCADHSYILYSFRVMHDGKKEERTRKNKIEIHV